ncbi:hypothetical protein C7M84_005238 [Penaeus vannamei]|uniref:Uncharacterized protein n=1 Tax=Penaeus vannamei TaxID=6689 RepID=A0A423TI93_PENVA|nr:hypothetical protein C7M84_005238 [Penaeus vannamei]
MTLLLIETILRPAEAEWRKAPRSSGIWKCLSFYAARHGKLKKARKRVEISPNYFRSPVYDRRERRRERYRQNQKRRSKQYDVTAEVPITPCEPLGSGKWALAGNGLPWLRSWASGSLALFPTFSSCFPLCSGSPPRSSPSCPLSDLRFPPQHPSSPRPLLLPSPICQPPPPPPSCPPQYVSLPHPPTPPALPNMSASPHPLLPSPMCQPSLPPPPPASPICQPPPPPSCPSLPPNMSASQPSPTPIPPPPPTHLHLPPPPLALPNMSASPTPPASPMPLPNMSASTHPPPPALPNMSASPHPHPSCPPQYVSSPPHHPSSLPKYPSLPPCPPPFPLLAEPRRRPASAPSAAGGSVVGVGRRHSLINNNYLGNKKNPVMPLALQSQEDHRRRCLWASRRRGTLGRPRRCPR